MPASAAPGRAMIGFGTSTTSAVTDFPSVFPSGASNSNSLIKQLLASGQLNDATLLSLIFASGNQRAPDASQPNLSSILAHAVLHGQRNGNLAPINPPVQERSVYTQDVPTNTPENDRGSIQVNETNSVPHQRQQQNFTSNFIESLPSSSPSYGQLVSISEENVQSPGRLVCRFDDGSVLSYRGIYERPRRPGEENYGNMVEIVDERCLRDSDIKREDIYERPRRSGEESYDNMVEIVDKRCLRDSNIKIEDMASKDAVIVEVPPNNSSPSPVPSVAKAALIDLNKRIDGKSKSLYSLSSSSEMACTIKSSVEKWQ